MASSVSKTLSAREKLRFSLLRAILFRQSLPSVVYSSELNIITTEIATLEIAGLIKRTGEQFGLTQAGRLALKKLNGDHMPPLIDLPNDALLSKERSAEFVVSKSLARRLGREISGGR